MLATVIFLIAVVLILYFDAKMKKHNKEIQEKILKTKKRERESRIKSNKIKVESETLLNNIREFNKQLGDVAEGGK